MTGVPRFFALANGAPMVGVTGAILRECDQ